VKLPPSTAYSRVRAGAHADIFEDVGERSTAFLDSVCDHAQIAVEHDHVGRGLRDARRTLDRKTDVRELQSRRIIYAVAKVPDDSPASLERAHQASLLIRCQSSECIDVAHLHGQGIVAEPGDIGAG